MPSSVSGVRYASPLTFETYLTEGSDLYQHVDVSKSYLRFWNKSYVKARLFCLSKYKIQD